jgi:hypothetical protein
LLATCAAQTRDGKEIREDWRREKAVKRHERTIATITLSKSLHTAIVWLNQKADQSMDYKFSPPTEFRNLNEIGIFGF